jgi:transcriptional regulator with XRE-family HTH domain
VAEVLIRIGSLLSGLKACSRTEVYVIGQNMPKETASFKSIGFNLRALREEAGLTLKEVATAAKLDVSLISKLERDIRLPTVAQCERLAEFYGVSAEALTNGTDAVKGVFGLPKTHEKRPAGRSKTDHSRSRKMFAALCSRV